MARIGAERALCYLIIRCGASPHRLHRWYYRDHQHANGEVTRELEPSTFFFVKQSAEQASTVLAKNCNKFRGCCRLHQGFARAFIRQSSRQSAQQTR